MNKLSITLVTIFSFLFLGVLSAKAATITVCASGCDQTTINAGIIAASTNDTIDVTDSRSYVENVKFDNSEDGKNLTLTFSAGATIAPSSGNFALEIDDLYNSGTLTFNNVNATGTTASALIEMEGVGTFNFNNCSIGDTTTTKMLFQVASGATSGTNINVTNTNFTQASNDTTQVMAFYSLMGTTTISGGTITPGNGHVFQISANTGNFVVNGITLNSTTHTTPYDIMYWAGAFTAGRIVFTNNIINDSYRGIAVTLGASSILLKNNVITINGTSVSNGLAIGIDGTTANQPQIGSAVIVGNTVNFTGTGHAHGILVGNGPTGAFVAYNKIINPDYGIVVKSYGANIMNNEVTGTTLAGMYLRGGYGNSIHHNSLYVNAGSGILLDTQDAGSSENTDTTVPSNANSVSAYQTFTSVGEGGSHTLLVAQPGIPFRPRMIIYNDSGGSLNLYEGITTFAVTGSYRGNTVTENITFTSSAGNKALANTKYRYKTGVNIYDHITSVVVTNIADGGLKMSVGTAGTPPTKNYISNNIFAMPSSNSSNMISEVTGVSDGNADENYFDNNTYYKTAGNLASLNGVSYATLASLQTGWTNYSTLFPGNDANSSTANPQFLSSTDLRISLTSPANGVKNTSSPSILNWNSNGAWQTPTTAVKPTRSMNFRTTTK